MNKEARGVGGGVLELDRNTGQRGTDDQLDVVMPFVDFTARASALEAEALEIQVVCHNEQDGG